MNKKQRSRVRKLDSALTKTARKIRILSTLGYDPQIAFTFLSQWKSGARVIPVFAPPRLRLSEEKQALKLIIKTCDSENALEKFLSDSAESYLLAAEMLENVSRKGFTRISTELYGSPRSKVGASNLMLLGAAKRFVNDTQQFIELISGRAEDVCILPDFVASKLQKRVNKTFKNHKVEVVVDTKLASKAAASFRRIRIRGHTCFSEHDFAQLLHHEAFVHTLTGINGREQALLKSLSLDAPRTASTQEGLAVFAEMITHSMDLRRLRRISLRVQAVEMALEGADFVEVFEFFLEAGQNEMESFHSAARIFRCGNKYSRVVFTKDIIYLSGFIQVHNFFLKAIELGHVHYPRLLCAGKMAVSDVALLEPHFDSEVLSPPTYLPEWIKDSSTLLAFLLYSSFAADTHLGKL